MNCRRSDVPQTIVAMITSNMARAGHPSRVTVRVGSGGERASGLLMDSVIMTDNLATVHYSEIDSVIGTFTGQEFGCGSGTRGCDGAQAGVTGECRQREFLRLLQIAPLPRPNFSLKDNRVRLS
jgi:hypothetical protein